MARVLLSGSSGLIGTKVTEEFSRAGHSLIPLTRPGGQRENGVAWDPARGAIDTGSLEGFDWVIHLAGESIAERWTHEKKRRIRESRVDATRLLCWALAKTTSRPTRLLSASAIGIYGNRGDECLTETSQPGDDFLARVGQEWEEATQAARDSGIDVVNARFGVVLSQHGGALAKLLPIFRSGAGGVIAGGKQYMSWISLEDVARAIEFCMTSPDLSGPVNVVSPQPVTNREFTHALGHILGRPTLVPMPAFGIRMMLGEMGEATVLASQRVLPEKLQKAAFHWEHPTLTDALQAALREVPASSG